MARKRIQTVTFTVTADKLRGQGRPRLAIIGGKPRAYKDDDDRQWEAAIRDAYFHSESFKDMAGFAGEVHMSVKVQRWLPKSAPKKLKESPDTGRPDCSNILKSVEDALNRVAYRDDSQIVKAQCEKLMRKRSVGEDGEYLERNEIMEVTIVYYAEVGTH